MDESLDQFKGWLKFFHIANLCALLFSFTIFIYFFLSSRDYLGIDFVQKFLPFIIYMAGTVFFYLRIALAVTEKKPQTPDLIVSLMTGQIIFIFIFVVIIRNLFASPSISPLSINKAIQFLTWYLLWKTYFKKSERVLTYYGKNAGKPKSEIIKHEDRRNFPFTKIVPIIVILFYLLLNTHYVLNTIPFMTKRGLNYLKEKQYPKALAEFNVLIDQYPNHAPYYFARALTYYHQELYNKAIRDCTNALVLGKEKDSDIMANCYDLRAGCYFKLNDFESAISDNTSAIKINEDNLNFYLNRAWTYYELKEYDKCWNDISAAEALGAPLPKDLVEKLTEKDRKK